LGIAKVMIDRQTLKIGDRLRANWGVRPYRTGIVSRLNRNEFGRITGGRILWEDIGRCERVSFDPNSWDYIHA
jgi:hypothetical protein